MAHSITTSASRARPSPSASTTTASSIRRAHQHHETESESDNDTRAMHHFKQPNNIKKEPAYIPRKAVVECDRFDTRKDVDDDTGQLDHLSKSQLIAKVRALQCLVTGLETKKNNENRHYPPQNPYPCRTYPTYYPRRQELDTQQGIAAPIITQNNGELPNGVKVYPILKREITPPPREVLGVINPPNNIPVSSSSEPRKSIEEGGCMKKRRGPYKRKGMMPDLSSAEIRNVLSMRKSGRPRECDKPQNTAESRQDRVKRLSRERVWRFRERQRIKAFLAQQPAENSKLGSLSVAAIQALEAEGRVRKMNSAQ